MEDPEIHNLRVWLAGRRVIDVLPPDRVAEPETWFRLVVEGDFGEHHTVTVGATELGFWVEGEPPPWATKGERREGAVSAYQAVGRTFRRAP